MLVPFPRVQVSLCPDHRSNGGRGFSCVTSSCCRGAVWRKARGPPLCVFASDSRALADFYRCELTGCQKPIGHGPRNSVLLAEQRNWKKLRHGPPLWTLSRGTRGDLKNRVDPYRDYSREKLCARKVLRRSVCRDLAFKIRELFTQPSRMRRAHSTCLDDGPIADLRVAPSMR